MKLDDLSLEEKLTALEPRKKKLAKDNARLLDKFESDPIDGLSQKLQLADIKFNEQEALRHDITRYVEADFLWKFLNASDVSLNIVGEPGHGKSNILLHYGHFWTSLTETDYDLTNVVYDNLTYSLLLKQIKVKPISADPSRITLEEFPLNPGTQFSLDEAADTNQTGILSHTTVLQTRDLENRLRAAQCARICAGVTELQHGAYYNIRAYQRLPKVKPTPLCIGLVYKKISNGSNTEKQYLGSVRIPYVPPTLFKAYNSPKLNSITAYGRGVTVNRVAQLMNYFVEKLRVDSEYQSLPTKPNSIRLNWLQRQPAISVFTTQSYFTELERLTRPDETALPSAGALARMLGSKPVQSSSPSIEEILGKAEPATSDEPAEEKPI